MIPRVKVGKVFTRWKTPEYKPGPLERLGPELTPDGKLCAPDGWQGPWPPKHDTDEND